MRAGVGRVWIASRAVLTCMGALSAACSTRGTSDVARSVSSADVDAQPHQSDGTGSDVASVVGTWEFAALTGVPPAELPPGYPRQSARPRHRERRFIPMGHLVRPRRRFGYGL